MRSASRSRTTAAIGVAIGGLLWTGCSRARVPPTIEFTEIPEASPGGELKMARIGGRVAGGRPGEQIVLFAKSGTWWVQPFAAKPFTPVQQDSSWGANIHLGTEYAAVLVSSSYSAPATIDVLPAPGGDVIARASVPGKPGEKEPLHPSQLQFSGYEWLVSQNSSPRGGVDHMNRSDNAWVDAQGHLHLRVAWVDGQWTCAELEMLRSLGYGSYSFTVRDMPKLEPGAVLGFFTWDDLEAGQNHREMDIELSQWGDPTIKNAQFAVQPYYVPANVFRFSAPTGTSTHSLHWTPGRVAFKTAQGSRVIAAHHFTSGVPSPGAEKVHLKLYLYGKSRVPQQQGVEVVIEKFEFLP